MAQAASLSGFPEWLPPESLAEQQVVDTLREVFELHGFGPLGLRAVEPLEWLLAKGETDKEIYVLNRLHAEPDGEDAGLGLRFDLTVPLARYLTENAGRLLFPLRVYQIQKVWRGERPQEGRFREFRQADIDVIGHGQLPAHYDAELPLVIADALQRLPLPPVRLRVNNRKIAEGVYRAVGITDITGTLRAVDKLDKIGREGVHQLLTDQVGCSDAQAHTCLQLADIGADDLSFVDQVGQLGVDDTLVNEGLEELAGVVQAGHDHQPGLVTADLSVARGLDYYTGTVYETQLVGHESIGSVCSGGRYDQLATTDGETYPGVGLSVGITRLLSRLFGQRLLSASRSVPTCVLIAVPTEDDRRRCGRIAAALRARGIACEVAPTAERYGKQIRYADRRGIPYVWFPTDPPERDEVRDIRAGEQIPADCDEWMPPPHDVHPALTDKR